jgi:uncharacterized Zn-finger protein
MKRKFEGTKKCAYCGRELTQDEILDAFEGMPEYQHMVYDGLISSEEKCPYCGYHNDCIEEVSLEMHYSIIT